MVLVDEVANSGDKTPESGLQKRQKASTNFLKKMKKSACNLFCSVIEPEFATCKVKTEPFRTPFYVVNMRFPLYLRDLKIFEKIYLHHTPI